MTQNLVTHFDQNLLECGHIEQSVFDFLSIAYIYFHLARSEVV